MDITKSGNIISLPNKTIRLNIDKINSIVKSSNSIVKEYIIRFIVAHEFAHQMQYQAYKDHPNYMNNDLVSRTIIETQADILASLMLLYINFELFDFIKQKPLLINEIFEELLNVAIEIGSNEHTIGTHPNKRDRALAFRLGFTNGLGYIYDQRVKANPALNIKMGLTPEIFKKQMDYILNFVDNKNDEELFAWSYRQAKKILNYDRKVSNNLVLITPPNQRITFHTGKSHPYVDYDLTYKNIGNKSIIIEMEVFVSLINRINPKSAKSFRKLNVNHYSFYLPPQGTYRIQDKLRWDKGENDPHGILEISKDQMPSIIYPNINTPDAIYSCSYVSKDSLNKVHQESIKYLNLLEKEDISLDFMIYINSILNTCLVENEDIIQGLGEKNFFLKNTLLYDSSIQYGQNTKTTVITDLQKQILKVELDFPHYSSQNNHVKNFYQNLKNTLDTEFSDCNKTEGQDSYSFWVTYRCDSYELFLQGKNNKKEDYPLYFSINLK
ncbi:ImmA/IrrE family metallo-endopeptidase [Algibacter sp. Ld11]|uniref:ImmA/IrrE family metallo-endopeptidase n=1 Tax=Algibacter sp. Ld11 TaxID=649150 RepID=UPI003863C4F9